MSIELRNYQESQSEKLPVPEEPTSTGVACTEKTCEGEMMWRNPREQHPEYCLRFSGDVDGDSGGGPAGC